MKTQLPRKDIQTELKKCVARRYGLRRAGHSWDILNNLYWRHCRQQSQPFVMGRLRVKYVYVSYDMPESSILDPDGYQELWNLQKNSGIKIDKVPLDKFDWFATRVYEICAASFARHPDPQTTPVA